MNPATGGDGSGGPRGGTALYVGALAAEVVVVALLWLVGRCFGS